MTHPPRAGDAWDRYRTGPANRVAAAAARRVAESPGRGYNPLLVQGAPGAGKSHLLRAIADLARRLDPELRIHLEELDALVDRLSAALADGTAGSLRQALASMDLLLLDDLERVAGRQRTQDELLLVLEEVLGRGGQLVVTSRLALAEVPGLHPALVAALGAGVSVDVALPDDAPADGGEGVGDGPAPHPAALADAAGEEVDEFRDFFEDVAGAVVEMVETEPWRRTLARAILRWEADGFRTRRLEAALEADTPPDVDALLAGFARDAARLAEIARALDGAPPADAELLRDPDRVADAERALRRVRTPAPPAPPPPATAAVVEPDRWFLDPDKLAWNWVGVDDRLPRELG